MPPGANFQLLFHRLAQAFGSRIRPDARLWLVSPPPAQRLFGASAVTDALLKGGSEGFKVWAASGAGQKLGEFGKIVDVFDGFYQAFGHLLETGLQNFHDGLLFRENLPLLAALLATFLAALLAALLAAFLATFLAELLFECHSG